MKIVKLLAVMLLGALLYQGGRTLLESEALELKEFEVEGNTESRVSTGQLVRATGVHPGERLVGISTGKVAGRLEKLPWVQEAEVERILPSTLRISITEREPALVVETGQGPFLVDGNGLVLQQGTDSLPVVRDLPLEALGPGTTITTAEFAHASEILSSLPPEISSDVSAVSASSIDQIQIETRGGPLIYYGAAEQIPEKNFAVQALIEKIPSAARASTVVDVRVPSRPSTRTV
jgi:cell division protein FtsQ